MPAKLRVQKRLYYKIGEACKLLDVQPYVLRYWETEFPALSPAKSRSGQRVYNEKELAIIRRIKELLYDEGYTIAGAKKKLEGELAAGLVGRVDLEGDEPDDAVAVEEPPAEPEAEAAEPMATAEPDASDDELPVPAGDTADPALAASAGAAIDLPLAPPPELPEPPPIAQLRLRPEPRRKPREVETAPRAGDAGDAGAERADRVRARVARALREARELLVLLDSKPPIK